MKAETINKTQHEAEVCCISEFHDVVSLSSRNVPCFEVLSQKLQIA